ncbi:putative RNA-directed RNA polymerase [Rosa chinensis]|uniref:RNA-dependent RNA polymerase n=1 Tax=Rosa chinensis TaxID=74649 RepID=A0A2P6RBC9_ROSCH|nr:RNA-dependent RNA polymerase 1 [Rosa chinensis]PRQ43735.1 putative RNA-directed RNA polymerase [Rosa chinensis]
MGPEDATCEEISNHNERLSRTVKVFGFPCTNKDAEETSPDDMSAQLTGTVVKSSVEIITGKESVDFVGLEEVNPKSNRYRYDAVVRFSNTNQANTLIQWAASGILCYGHCRLKAEKYVRDNVPRSKTPNPCMENLTMHFGCQTKDTDFYSLWGADNVSMAHEVDPRRLTFIMEDKLTQYKLQFYDAGIHEFELRCPRVNLEDDDGSSFATYLLMKLKEAPRIFKEVDHGPQFKHPYYRISPDKEWVRATDFTPSYSIGQSSVVCLIIGHTCLPNFLRQFSCPYKQRSDGLRLVQGDSYSIHLDYKLVPIVESLDLPYEIVYKINSLVQRGKLVGPNLDKFFYHLMNLKSQQRWQIEFALDRLGDVRDTCYDPCSWLEDFYSNPVTSKSATSSSHNAAAMVPNILVTPSKVYFNIPKCMSNRVLRIVLQSHPHLIGNFLRVSFVEENMSKLYFNKDDVEIKERILAILRNGLRIAEKKFEFLAFTGSQLRNNSLWMFASTPELTASSIRKKLGNFSHLKNPAKYAARLGLSFGESVEAAHVTCDEYEHVEDIIRGKFVFSDGIGKISESFARKVARACHLSETPSAFQIRYAGYKGVVAIDPDLKEKKLILRDSMRKYQSQITAFDILSHSMYIPYFLNRQLILLMSSRGVEDEVFLEKQRLFIQQLTELSMNPSTNAHDMERYAGERTNTFKELDFFDRLDESFRDQPLKVMRNESRIYIPDGRVMMGCLDETAILEHGQVFVQYSQLESCGFDERSKKEKKSIIVKGNVVIARSPCLHPGDLLVLTAVDIPALHHMVDCVVFSQNGERPNPDKTSGGDLDGDLYHVCWDPTLIPSLPFDAADYPASKSSELNEVKIEDVKKYFVEYMLKDTLGKITNAWYISADLNGEGARSSQCLDLAQLASKAVDSAKSGEDVSLPFFYGTYPDFMEKNPNQTYKSNKVLGKLYRQWKTMVLDES